MSEKTDREKLVSSSIKIRRGRREDFPIIKDCLIYLWVEHARQEPGLLDEERMRASNVEDYYQECLDEPDEHSLFVAEVDGEFAGFIRADIKKIPSFFKHPEILYLDDLYVLPEFRRKGVARSLIQRAEKLAREKGIERLQARVYSFNKEAQELLKSMGYHSPHGTWDKVTG
jgi:GNAT superfamily N-acetyltransferase